MRKIDCSTIRSYCIRNNLFTCGSCKQYNAMFAYNDEHPDKLHDTAIMIWLCSETTKTIEIIENDLRELAKNY